MLHEFGNLNEFKKHGNNNTTKIRQIVTFQKHCLLDVLL